MLCCLIAGFSFLFLLVPAQDAAQDEVEQLAVKAQELARAKDFDQAVLLMRKVIQLAPQSDQFLGIISDMELKAGKFADGLAYQSATYEISGAKSSRLIKGDVNDMVNVVPQGSMPLKLNISVTITPYSFKQSLAKAVLKPLPPAVKAYLGPVVAIDPKSP